VRAIASVETVPPIPASNEMTGGIDADANAATRIRGGISPEAPPRVRVHILDRRGGDTVPKMPIARRTTWSKTRFEASKRADLVKGLEIITEGSDG
jgi:hypothetical protein